MEAQNESANDSVPQIVDDPNVLKSEIDDIRKSVVSMSVGQPARTSTIVKEWLEQPAPEASCSQKTHLTMIVVVEKKKKAAKKKGEVIVL